MRKRRYSWYSKRGGFTGPWGLPKTPGKKPWNKPGFTRPYSTPTGGRGPSSYPKFEPLGTPTRRGPTSGIEKKPEPARSNPTSSPRTQTKVKRKPEQDEKVPKVMVRRRRVPPRARRYKRKDQKSQRISPRMVGSTYSYFKYIKKNQTAARIKRVGPKQQYLNTYSTRLTATTGTQAAVSFNEITNQHLNTLTTSVPSSLEPAASYKTSTICLESCVNNIMLTNQDNANAFIEIYEIMVRRDTQQSPEMAWMNGMTDAGGTSTSYTNLMATPFMSPRFVDFFYVRKKYKFELGPGRSHIHRSTIVLNSKYSDELKQPTGWIDFLKNWTHFQMVVAFGAPINSLATPTNVTSSKINIDIIQTFQLKWTYLAPMERTYAFYAGLPTVTDPNVMNEESGTVQTETSA